MVAAVLLFVTAKMQKGLLTQAPSYTAQQLYQVAQQNVSQGHFDQAETYLQEALKAQDTSDYHSQLAVVEYRLKKYPEAVAEYQKLLDKKYEVAFAYNGLGNVYRDWSGADQARKDEYVQKAITNYQAAIQADDHYLVAYSNLAQVQIQEGDKAAGIATLQAGIGKTQAPELQAILKNSEG